MFLLSGSITFNKRYEDNQIKSDRIVKHLNESLTDLQNLVNSKEIPENGNPNKIIEIV